jgi:hypothetical protein
MTIYVSRAKKRILIELEQLVDKITAAWVKTSVWS